MPPSGHFWNFFIRFSGEWPIVKIVSLTAEVKLHYSDRPTNLYIHSDGSFIFNIDPNIMAIRNYGIMISDTT